MLARRERPDPEDAADRAAVDAVFESLARAFAEHPPDAQALIEDDYVRRTGMLPAALRDRLIGGMLSEDPAAQVAAAGRFVAFENSDPVLLVPLPADTLTRARAIKAFTLPNPPPSSPSLPLFRSPEDAFPPPASAPPAPSPHDPLDFRSLSS